MRFFLDTEFIESGPGRPIQLISIGIVAADGRELYAVSSEFNPRDASGWVMDNVLSKISAEDYRKAETLRIIARGIVQFVGHSHETPEFWGYFADYDWVVFCQIFGTMMDLPKGWPMFCMDIKQLCVSVGNPQLPPQPEDEHNALADARWNKVAWEFLRDYRRSA